MGCLCSRSKGFEIKSNDVSSEKGYSWDQKNSFNPQDFIVQGIKDDTVVKLPGTVNGQQFIIQNCENSCIYVLDYTNTVSVDDCNNCNIFLGPVKGSVFLRDCKKCRVLVASQQFRARDCKLIDVFLCCATQPIIESCSDMRFGCFCYHYEQLEDQFRKAGLSMFNNSWSNVHDFTPESGEQNWSLLPKDARIEDFFPVPSAEKVSDVKISTDPANSTVPQTCGYHQKISHQNCLVVFFNDGHSQKRAMAFMKEMQQTENVLMKTKEVLLDEVNAQHVFGTESYNSVIRRGPIIALEYNGENCTQCCQETAKAIATETGCTGLVYVSNTSKTANKQIESLFNYSEIHMSN